MLLVVTKCCSKLNFCVQYFVLHVALRSLPTFAGGLREKIRTCAGFKKIPTNYISEESLINGVYDKSIGYVIFPFSKCEEAVRVETTEIFLVNLSGIGYCSTCKMNAHSHSQSINKQKCVRLFGYSDWLSRYPHLKFE